MAKAAVIEGKVLGGGSAGGEVNRIEVPTSDRIVDAAVLHVRLTGLQAEFRRLAKHAAKLAETVYIHQASAVSALQVGEQTLLFGTADQATLAKQVELTGALVAALNAAHGKYNPADHED